MAGQATLAPTAALAPLAALEALLEDDERARSAAHATRLRHVHALVVEHRRHGFELATAPTLALALNCSEHRAWDLVEQAELLSRLPSGLDVLASGLLAEEHSRLVATVLGRLDAPEAERVWLRLVPLLERLRQQGAAYPPKRLEAILTALVLEICPPAAADAPAADRGDVTYDRADDGSVDVHVLGMSPPTAQAALSRIAQGAQPAGPWDSRTSGQRRRDAAVDLLLGRAPLPATDSGDPQPDTARCGCAPGSPAVCGADVAVLVPLPTAAGLSTVPGELVGHGPVPAADVAALLASAPRLRPVFVDDAGVPVAVGTAQQVPARDDPVGLAHALVRLAVSPPGERFAVHPSDHPPPEAAGRTAAHPPDEPGPYTIRPHLRRLLRERTLRCEWPGCGARAARCDLDHDVAWPDGPTCSCNLGALCRRHHRVKQLGWVKTRRPDGGVSWQSPSGRTHVAPAQLPRVPDAVVPPTARPEEPSASPAALHDDALWADPTHPDWALVDSTPLWMHSTPGHDPEGDHDAVGTALAEGGTAWGLDLADPYRWLPVGDWADEDRPPG